MPFMAGILTGDGDASRDTSVSDSDSEAEGNADSLMDGAGDGEVAIGEASGTDAVG